MRRFKQELPVEVSKRILAGGRECVLALSGDDGYPYALPINYFYDGQHIYIHSAQKGHKIDSLMRNPKLSLCVIDKADVVPEKFTTYFRSVIVFGKARFIVDEEEKILALRKLSEKYSADIDPTEEINRFLKVVTIIEISIDRITGKQAIELCNPISSN